MINGNSYNITNAQVLDFINKRLYEVSNMQGNLNFDEAKNSKIKIITKIASYLLFGLSAILIMSTLLAPIFSIGNSLLIKLIGPSCVGLLGGGALMASNIFSEKNDTIKKELSSINHEAIILQQIREYINGHAPITKEIQNNLDLITKNIYEKENEQYKNPIASSSVVDNSNTDAIKAPFVVQGPDLDLFAKKEYSRLKDKDFAGDGYYFIQAIDNGKYNNDYTPAVLTELKKLAVHDIAQSFYENLVITYSLTPDIIINNIRRGIYNNKHSKEVLEEALNVANYYKNNENVGKAV